MNTAFSNMQESKRTRARVAELPSDIPNVPVFDSEASLDVEKEATTFLASFANAVQNGVQQRDWQAFEGLWSDNAWWRDSLTLTFDKRTLHGKRNIRKAWNTLAMTRKPVVHHSPGFADMEARFERLAPTLASLDVPFRFSTDTPKSMCIGLAKLIPEGEGKDKKWKIWVLATAITSLHEHPFSVLPRQSPSLIDHSQRGHAHAQGLPRVNDILDAIVIGGSHSGIANTIMLDAIGAQVVAFELESVAGGNWVTQRYENVTLHHPAFMIQLPMFPVSSEEYPTYLNGSDLRHYYSAAVEKLQLPFFAGIEVVSNTYDFETQIWRVRINDVKTGHEAIIETRNIVISTGFIVSPSNPKFPALTNQNLFTGPVQHTTEYRTAEPYKDKDVVVVGSGNSAHDVAQNLSLNGAKTVTILQRSPTVLLDYDVISPLLTMRYSGAMSVDTADFLENSLPLGILRDMARGAVAMMIQGQAERGDAFEEKGYMVDRTPCLISRAYEERGRAFYMDHLKVFDLVFKNQIKIARGEAKGFVKEGLMIKDMNDPEAKEEVLKAQGVVLATGYAIVDLPKKYAESGFVDPKSAAILENVSLFGVDVEGEVPGYTTSSGRKCRNSAYLMLC